MANKPQAMIPSPILHHALNELNQFPAALKLIRAREHLGLTQLARTLSISKQQAWQWQAGKALPREALTLLSILSWARKLSKG